MVLARRVTVNFRYSLVWQAERIPLEQLSRSSTDQNFGISLEGVDHAEPSAEDEALVSYGYDDGYDVLPNDDDGDDYDDNAMPGRVNSVSQVRCSSDSSSVDLESARNSTLLCRCSGRAAFFY